MNKKIIAVFLIVVLALITAVGIFVLFKNKNFFTPKNESEIFTYGVKTKILNYSKSDKLSDRIDTLLNKLNDPKLDDKTKYQELIKLSFYFASEYSVSHDPSLRIFVADELSSYAKTNFPKYYHAYDFDIPCSDPSCGNNIDSRANAIIISISNNNGVDQFYINTILKNLRTALYIPDDNMEEKKSGLNLVISQLQEVNNPQASKSAEDIKKYFYDKYKTGL